MAKFKYPLKPKELKPKFYLKEIRTRLTLLEKILTKKHGQKKLIELALAAGDLTEDAAGELQEFRDWKNL